MYFLKKYFGYPRSDAVWNEQKKYITVYSTGKHLLYKMPPFFYLLLQPFPSLFLLLKCFFFFLPVTDVKRVGEREEGDNSIWLQLAVIIWESKSGFQPGKKNSCDFL